jgi:hypothetical protein
MALAWFAERRSQGLSQEDQPRRGGTVSEARTGKRFPLELPIKIHKESASGDAKGTTGNLSAAGV